MSPKRPKPVKPKRSRLMDVFRCRQNESHEDQRNQNNVKEVAPKVHQKSPKIHLSAQKVRTKLTFHKKTIFLQNPTGLTPHVTLGIAQKNSNLIKIQNYFNGIIHKKYNYILWPVA